MTTSEFLKIIGSLKPDKHIMAGRRGSERNVQIKIVVPLLQFLGYNIIEDVDFEVTSPHMSVDVVVLDKIIIETKSWGQPIASPRHLAQGLDYTLAHCTSFVMITSGQYTVLFSSLLDSDNLNNTEPIIQFSFKDLLSKDGKDILSKLYLLLSKESLLNGAEELNKAVSRLLPHNKDINKAKKDFETKCKKFKSSRKSLYRITDEDFIKRASNHPKKVYDALILAQDEFHKINKENKNFEITYRGKSMGFEYAYVIFPRRKTKGLAEINPESARIALGMGGPGGWRNVISSPEIVKQLGEFPRAVKDERQIKNLVALLRRAIKELPEHK